MGAILSAIFGKKETQTPITCWDRVKNIANCHFRGIVGLLGVVVIISLTIKLKNPGATSLMIWLVMCWCLLLHPVHYTAVGFIPMAFLPLFGVVSTNDIMSKIMNQGTFFFVIGGYLIMIFNCTGMDKRIAYKLLTINPKKAISPAKLIMKASFVSYLLAALSSRNISTEIIMKTMIPSLGNLQSATAGRKGEMNYAGLKYQICNAIASSSCLGSLLFVHSSPAVMAFKAIYQGVSNRESDTFNFAQYTMFAAPFTIVTFCINLGCNIMMCSCLAKGKISLASTAALSAGIERAKDKIPPKMTCHEIKGIVAMIVLLAGYCSRFCFGKGWSQFRSEEMIAGRERVPLIYDVTWAVVMVVLLVNIPNSWTWLKTVHKLTENQYKAGGKPTTAILFWRLVDKATSYAHMFLICGGIAITIALKKHYTKEMINIGSYVTEMEYMMGILVIVTDAAFFSNFMAEIAVVVSHMPYPLFMVDHSKLQLDKSARTVWENRMHLAALGTGIASSFGFCARFRYTPMYYSHTIGMVPENAQIKSSILSVIMCSLSLYAFLAFLGPMLMSESYIYPAVGADVKNVTIAGDATTAAPARL